MSSSAPGYKLVRDRPPSLLISDTRKKKKKKKKNPSSTCVRARFIRLTDYGPESHDLTEMCFKKCVTSTIKNNKLDGSEESCLSNCVDRFMDVSMLSVKHLQSMRQ